MIEVVVKEIDNEEPKEETIPEPTQEEARQSPASYREAPKEEEKPEETIEPPVEKRGFTGCNFAAAGALFFARGTLSHLFNGVSFLCR